MGLRKFLSIWVAGLILVSGCNSSSDDDNKLSETYVGKDHEIIITSDGSESSTLKDIFVRAITEQGLALPNADKPFTDEEFKLASDSVRAKLESELGEAAGSGQGSLVLRSVDDILRQLNNGIPEDPPEGTQKECIEAYTDKRNWHISSGSTSGLAPDGSIAFGKIVQYSLKPPLPEQDVFNWTGSMNVCTWLGLRNFYFVIDFRINKEHGLRLSTLAELNGLSPELAEQFALQSASDGINYKLHANFEGPDPDHGFEYSEVYENSVQLSRTGDAFYSDSNAECFDMFFVAEPTGDMMTDLSDQNNFCMGRCDLRVMNTGR